MNLCEILRNYWTDHCLDCLQISATQCCNSALPEEAVLKLKLLSKETYAQAIAKARKLF